jgi:hypothetical protein
MVVAIVTTSVHNIMIAVTTIMNFVPRLVKVNFVPLVTWIALVHVMGFVSTIIVEFAMVMGQHALVVIIHGFASRDMTATESVQVNRRLMNVEYVVVSVRHVFLQQTLTVMDFSMENHIVTIS